MAKEEAYKSLLDLENGVRAINGYEIIPKSLGIKIIEMSKSKAIKRVYKDALN